MSEIYKLSLLPNGVRVATAEMPHMHSVRVGLWVGVGSRCEAPNLNGVCHFLEHLLFKGTARRSARQISEAVEGIGGYLNAFTSEEATCFHARAAHDRFGELLDVLLDMLLHSKLAPADVAREREVIKEEISMYFDEPQHYVQELLNATLWPGQPLGRPITGTQRSLDGLQRPVLAEYLRNNYVAANTIVVAAGKITHKRVMGAAAPYLRGFSRGPAPVFIPAREAQREPRLRLLTKDTEQTQIALGIRTCSRHDPRRYALRLLNTILGENMSSRLFQVLREDRGLVYSVYSTPSFFADAGDLVISAGLDADKLPLTLRLILGELHQMAEKAPGAAELRRARDYVIGQIELGQENTESQMNWVGEQLLGYGKIHDPSWIKRALSQVDAVQIQRAARDFFAPERLNLAMISPLKSAGHVEKLLRSGS